MDSSDADDDLPDDTYTALMEATYRTLADEGYDELTLRNVAERADKSRGLVHYHFDSKDDLVRSLLDYLLARLETEFAAFEDQSARAQLRTVLERIAYGPGGAEDVDDAYFRALFALRAQAPFDVELCRRLTRNYRAAVDQCAAAIEAGIESGEFRTVDPEATAVFLVNAVDGARNADLTLDTSLARGTAFEVLESLVFDAMTSDGGADEP